MKKNEIYIIALIIFFSGILVVDPFFHRGIFSAHDMPSNLTYFGAFYSSLKEGILIPRWAGNIANLYGSPTTMFFYPLSYYLASPFALIGLSLIDTMKLFIFITFILSSIFMYIWLRKHFSNLPSLTGALLYSYAPYRINDIYARGSIAENTAFMFIPLTALMLFFLWKKTNMIRLIWLSLVTSAFILSHPFIFLIFIPFYFAYTLYLKLDLGKIKLLSISAFITFGLISFYALPLVFENKYTHYDISPFNGQYYYEQFVSLPQLVLPRWSFIDRLGKVEYQTYQIGLLQIGLIFISLMIFLIKRVSKSVENKYNVLFAISILNLIFSTFLMLSISDFVYKSVPLLKRIEFPWRFLAVNLFTVSLLSAITMSLIQSSRVKKLFFVIIVVSGLMLYLPFSAGRDYKVRSDDHYLYNITENTDAFATLPRWAAQPDKYPRIGERYQLIDGDAKITTLSRNSTTHIYNSESHRNSRILDATFYFPGWNVYIDGKRAEIEFQDPSFRGLITFFVPKGKHLIEVKFENTKLRLIADLITIGSLVMLIILYKKNILIKDE